MKSPLIIPLILCLFVKLNAQVAIGSNNASPDSSAMLDVQSTNKGLLIPRMTSADRMAIITPAAGLLLYQTDGAKGLWFYDGTAWMVGSVFTLVGDTISNGNGEYSSNDFVVGSPSLDYDGNPDHTEKMFFNKSKAAFRAGSSSTANWDRDSTGLFSIAAGINTRAIGNYTTAMGFETTARGNSSIAMGSGSVASGANSVSMGKNTFASELYAVAMGFGSRATGFAATALGDNTKASESFSFAVGKNSEAIEKYSAAIGYYTKATGLKSIALGDSTSANGIASTASGRQSTAIGNYSVAMGQETMASGEASVALGRQTTASGLASLAMGDSSIASGSYSTAMGFETRAGSFGSIALGSHAVANNVFSVALGSGPLASGISSTAIGFDAEASGIGSIAIGVNAIASSAYSMALGENTVASDTNSTALGLNTEASGQVATSLGNSTVASGDYSTALGNNTTATEEAATALGHFTDATGPASTAMGVLSVASGVASSSMGILTQARGKASTAGGDNTMAHGYASTVIGMYNDTIVTTEDAVQNTTPLFIIGNGSSGFLSNAMVVRKDGRVGIGISAPRYHLHVGNGNIPATNGSNTRMVVADNDNGQRAAVLGLAKTIDGSKVEAQLEANGSTNAGPSVIIGASTSHPLYLRTGNFTRMTVSASGNVGIGVLAPAYKLEVNGDAAKPSGGSWTSTSDRRLKSDIHEYDAGLTDILRIRPVKFHYNQLSGYDVNKEHVGVIAQELQEISPDMVGTFLKDGVEYLTVNNSEMTYMLINAVQELSIENNEMKAELHRQRYQLNYQQRELEALKKQASALVNAVESLSAAADY